MNEFAELPDGITALSRLTHLRLGRRTSYQDPLQLRGNARALGDLSAFPALCRLGFEFCEVMLCESLVGAAQ